MGYGGLRHDQDWNLPSNELWMVALPSPGRARMTECLWSRSHKLYALPCWGADDQSTIRRGAAILVSDGPEWAVSEV